MAALTEEKILRAADCDRLLEAHDGDVALLCLYVLRHGTADVEGAARQLCRTKAEIEAAREKLGRLGLLPAEALPQTPAPQQEKLPPALELPEYRAEDVVRRSREDPAFSAILAEAERVLGHALSSADLKRLFGIYDYLALPAEVVLVLLNYCVAVSKGRLPSIRFIEKEAYTWANREILTLEQAEDYIAEARRRDEQSSRIAESMGIVNRALTPTEIRYITSWLEMGFGPEEIALAYDRTVTNTGALKWSYLNRILQSWKEKGLLTVRDIEEKDSRRRNPAPAPKTDRPIDLSDLKSLLKGKS